MPSNEQREAIGDEKKVVAEVYERERMDGKAIDWYERRDDLCGGMVFRTSDDSIVELYQRVPGDGTKWRVLDFYNGAFLNDGSTLEPGDLREIVTRITIAALTEEAK